jgi:hypothetical protein
MTRRALAIVALAVVVGTGGAAARAQAPRVPPFRHVIVIVFENKERPAVLGSGAAPTFDALGRRYARLDRYRAVAHPSLPNYLALVSGTTDGLRHDCVECVVRAPTLADTLGAAGLSWKTYVEGVTLRGIADIDRANVKARIPFLYAAAVLARDAELDRVVPLAQLHSDLAHRRLPTFSLVVPSLCHDMHNCSVATGDRWLGPFLAPLLRAGGRVAVFVVFDESRTRDRRGGGGHVAALVLGPLVRPGAVSHERLSHYDLLRTVEAGLGVPPLGRSAGARAIGGIWRPAAAP